MNQTYGEPEKKDILPFEPVDIKIEDLFDINWKYWVTGIKMESKDVDDVNYYIYSILGGIIFLRFDEKHQLAVKEFVEKRGSTNYNKAYLAWYEITHKREAKEFNMAEAAKVPTLRIEPARIARTIDAELKAPNSAFPGVTFKQMSIQFMNDVKAAVAADDPEKVRLAHNKFTSYIINHIVRVPGTTSRDRIFKYNTRSVTHKDDRTGKSTKAPMVNDEVHCIVYRRVSVAGVVKQESKRMPTLPLITGGGRHDNPWSIENILLKGGEIIGLVDTPIARPSEE